MTKEDYTGRLSAIVKEDWHISQKYIEVHSLLEDALQDHNLSRLETNEVIIHSASVLNKLS